MRNTSKKGLVGLIGLISAASILLFLIFVFLLSSATVPEIAEAQGSCYSNCNSWPTYSCSYGRCFTPDLCNVTDNCNHASGYRPNVTTEVWCEHTIPGSDCVTNCFDEYGNPGVLMGMCFCSCVKDYVPPSSCTEYCPEVHTLGPASHMAISCPGGTYGPSQTEYSYAGTECRRNWYPFYGQCAGVELISRYVWGTGGGGYRWNSVGYATVENPTGDTHWCSDGHDNDCDGRIDKNDTDCDSTPPAVPVTCENRVINGNPPQQDGNCSCAGGTCIRNYTNGDSTIYVVLGAQDTGGGVKEVRYCLVSGSIWGTSGPGFWNDPANGIGDEEAEYDPAFGAPSCVTGGSPCTMPRFLLSGKDGGSPVELKWSGGYPQYIYDGPFFPPEKNHPNTIDLCEDWGNVSNSTVERIKVWVNDADKTINQGNTLYYNITVHCNRTSVYSGAPWPNLLVYYTSSPTATPNSQGANPTWVKKATYSCTSQGIKTFTGSFALDNAAGNHAIRAYISYEDWGDSGTYYTCTNDNWLYADFDDLVFYVAPSSGSCTPTILLPKNTYWSDLYNKYYLIHDENSTVNYKSWDYARNSVSGQYTAKLQQITAPPPSGVNPTPPYFIIRKGSSSNKALVGSNGAMNITGTKSENQGSITPSGDDFVVKNSAGVVKAMIDGTTGNLYLAGTVNENQASLSPSGSGNFIIKSSAGEVVAYFDSGGNLWLKKTLNPNSPVSP